MSRSITLSFDYNDDHPPGQTTFDKSNPLTTSSSYPGADPAGGSHALRLVWNKLYYTRCNSCL